VLSFFGIAAVLATPCAFAKKDLFANEPAANHASHTQHLVTNSSTSVDSGIVEPNTQTVAPAAVEKKTARVEKNTENKPSYIEAQFIRLKGHVVETKEDLFGSKNSSKKITPNTKAAAGKNEVSEDQSSESVKPEVPVISATEAAQRAQTFADGQVINVRQYQDEGNQRYAVKLLQKNGRMKTVNLNAVNGELIEETTD
jgi:uncharacterized membrane protein YkoI